MGDIFLDDDYGNYVKHNGKCYVKVGDDSNLPDIVGPPDGQGFSDCDECNNSINQSSSSSSSSSTDVADFSSSSGNLGMFSSFNGTNNFLNIPAVMGFQSEENRQENLKLPTDKKFSFSFWVKRNSSSDASIISKFSDNTAIQEYSIRIASNKLEVIIKDDSNNDVVNLTGETDIAVGQLTHVVVASDNLSVKTYVNGTYDNGEFNSGTPRQSTSNFTIAASSKAVADDFFSGTILYITKWDKTLSQSDVTELYNNGVPLNYFGMSKELYRDIKLRFDLQEVQGQTDAELQDVVSGNELTNNNDVLFDGGIDIDDDCSYEAETLWEACCPETMPQCFVCPIAETPIEPSEANIGQLLEYNNGEYKMTEVISSGSVCEQASCQKPTLFFGGTESPITQFILFEPDEICEISVTCEGVVEDTCGTSNGDPTMYVRMEWNALNIVSVTPGNPATVTTSANHELSATDEVIIVGLDTTPSINGTHTVNSTGSNTFTVSGINVTSVADGSGQMIDSEKTWLGCTWTPGETKEVFAELYTTFSSAYGYTEHWRQTMGGTNGGINIVAGSGAFGVCGVFVSYEEHELRAQAFQTGSTIDMSSYANQTFNLYTPAPFGFNGNYLSRIYVSPNIPAGYTGYITADSGDKLQISWSLGAGWPP